LREGGWEEGFDGGGRKVQKRYSGFH
jgi:hypothetical protein